MKAEITVATVSGKAYYKLVSELKRRGLSFLSLKPTDAVPLDIKVVITTEGERQLITHPCTLVYDAENDPTEMVNEAIRLIQGKPSYDEVVIGVDPGRTFGVAIIGDGRVLETANCSSLKETIDTILKALEKVPAAINRVRIGNGAPVHTKELLHSLNKTLPKESVIEIVCEAGTSQPAKGMTHRREAKNKTSAIKIAERKGRIFPRGKPR